MLLRLTQMFRPHLIGRTPEEFQSISPPQGRSHPYLLNQYFYKDETVSFAGDTSWHDVLTSCYGMTEPSQGISVILDARKDIKTFDDDKVDLIDLCSRIVNYSPAEP